MFSLLLLNSSEVMSFLTLTAIFLFIGLVLIIRIITMLSNLKQKISDKLYARVTRIINDLNIKNNEIELEYQTNFTRISSEFITINATIQVFVSNMVRHDVDSILAQRTESASDKSDQSDQHSVANNSEASSQLESSHESFYFR